MKLLSPIPSNTVKLIEIYNKVISGTLDTGPDFQRKLVWKKLHKYAFIETILLNFPFPEIYIASTEMDMEKLQAREVVVDGKQRITTIMDYIQGVGDFANVKKIKPFDDLTQEEKRDFLNYSVSVKDLKDIGDAKIQEVFKRINSTNYSLNLNEVLNAAYGGGEFAIFCKLLADKDYKASDKETDINIEEKIRETITNFFINNNVFTENDVKRMYDSQYIMLIVSTFLEGKYFGRNSRINFYLEKYNEEFSIHSVIVKKILQSISIIEKLKFSHNSYWFNRPNLFTLIFELSSIPEEKIDLDMLEQNLIDLENKVDIYFDSVEEEANLLSVDETKYFEVSRQGSNELASREHRGKVISDLINKSLKETKLKQIEDEFYSKNLFILDKKRVRHSYLIPTITGLTKNVLDATSTVREFLKEKEIHDYEKQGYGPMNKVKIEGSFVLADFHTKPTEISLYRSNGRGDYRIWFTDLKDFAEANDVLILIQIEKKLHVLNIIRFNYTNFISNIDSL
jgi:hypothetical protein